MNIEQLATELITLREEIARLEVREDDLRQEIETHLVSVPENRLHAADHDFTLVPPGSSSQLNEDLLRETLQVHGWNEGEIDQLIKSATKTSPRDSYLRISRGAGS